MADRIDVALLSEGLRRDLLASRGQEVVSEHLARSWKLLLAGLDHATRHHRDRLPDRILREVVASLQELEELLEDAADALGLVGGPRDRDLVASNEDVCAEGAFDELQEGIALAEQGDHRLVTRDQDLHLCGGGCHVFRHPGRRPVPSCSKCEGRPADGHLYATRCQPGGQPIGRPPSRWKCRWKTA